MPDLSKLRDYTRNADFKAGDIVEFVDKGQILDVDFSAAKDGSGMKRVLQIGIKINNDAMVRKHTLNSGSRQLLSEAWGQHTEDWIGKTAKATFIKQQCFGKLTDVLILEPIEGEEVV